MLDQMQRTKQRAAQLERFAATGDVSVLRDGEADVGVNLGNEYHIVQQSVLWPVLTIFVVACGAAAAALLLSSARREQPPLPAPDVVSAPAQPESDWRLGAIVTDSP